MDFQQSFYTSLAYIFPSQVRYSKKNVEDKIQKALGDGDAIFNDSTQKYDFRYHQNKSIFDLNVAVPVIRTTNKMILADGHHSVLASLALGCQSIPVFVIDEWLQDLDVSFWDWAEAHNYAYLWDLDGKKLPEPQTFSDLKDDPLRYFAALTARKYIIDLNPLHSTGLDYPLWIKIGKDIPFIEMRMANTLYQAGFRYTYGQELTASFPEMVEQARQILIDNPIDGLKLLPQREYYLSSPTINHWLGKVTS